MQKPINLSQQGDILTHIESLLEYIYDVVQDIRDDDVNWLTPEINIQIQQAQKEAERGEYEEFTSVSDMIQHLHQSKHAQS